MSGLSGPPLTLKNCGRNGQRFSYILLTVVTMGMIMGLRLVCL